MRSYWLLKTCTFTKKRNHGKTAEQLAGPIWEKTKDP